MITDKKPHDFSNGATVRCRYCNVAPECIEQRHKLGKHDLDYCRRDYE